MGGDVLKELRVEGVGEEVAVEQNENRVLSFPRRGGDQEGLRRLPHIGTIAGVDTREEGRQSAGLEHITGSSISCGRRTRTRTRHERS